MKKSVLVLCCALAATGCSELTPILEAGAGVASASGYGNQQQLVDGIKQALELGADRATTELSADGGYSNSEAYRIELPENVQNIATTLRRFGLGGQIDRVESLMNEGAEQAAAAAKPVFVDAIKNMSVTDALTIIRGSNTEATDYFRTETETSLRTRYQPIIDESLQKIGFYSQYQQLLKVYEGLPINNKPNLDLEQHVLTASLDALFKQIAVEEQAIRQDPVGKGTQLIYSVFGNPQTPAQ
ncbi:DUF4197 domain-containing protein [Halioxenophilus aromaticivorans]|uniref:DUF4197 domain-containing protein n=1 Tax=Halioxenophilus aromaticivorans TaxID=1306992 RepID=A0AAV3U9E2_9ALTE